MAQFLYPLTSSNFNRFSKLFHCQNQEKTCNNNTITKDPTTPQVCRYTGCKPHSLPTPTQDHETKLSVASQTTVCHTAVRARCSCWLQVWVPLLHVSPRKKRRDAYRICAVDQSLCQSVLSTIPRH